MKRNDSATNAEWLSEARRFLHSHLEILRALQNAAADRAQKFLLLSNAGAVVATLSYIGASSSARSSHTVWVALSLFVGGVIFCGLLVAISYHGTAGDMRGWIRDMDRFYGNKLDLQDIPSNLNRHLNRWNRLAVIAGYVAFFAFIIGSATAIHAVSTASQPATSVTTSQQVPVASGATARTLSPGPPGWWIRVATDPSAEFAGMVALFTLA